MVDCYWIRNSEATIRNLRKASRGVALIPLASIESHGPHLPVGCDPIKTDNLVRQIVREETVAVLPTVVYSFVAEARMLPGAIHIRSDVLMEYVENICDEVHRNGFRKIILLHGHGGNVALHQMFCKRMLEREKPYVVYSVSAQADLWDKMKAMGDSAEWGHACEWETSMAMVACPELVHVEVLHGKTFPAAKVPDTGAALTAADWIGRHPEMAVGEPQKASRKKGERWLGMATKALVDVIRKVKADTRTATILADYRRRAQRPGRHGAAR